VVGVVVMVEVFKVVVVVEGVGVLGLDLSSIKAEIYYGILCFNANALNVYNKCLVHVHIRMIYSTDMDKKIPDQSLHEGDTS